MPEITKIKKPVARWGKRRHVEIPKEYYDEFQIGDYVIITLSQSARKDKQ